ncbi:MAG TPA: hypothetical protein VFO73_09485 [Candidatus Limnocylindrales bacterium]|nr:hypothetical protein [Candidatus Limnocylindrales bacterium]
MSVRRARAVALALFMVVGVTGVATTTADAATDQLRDSAVSTYELLPARGIVRVTIVLTLTNRAPSTSKSRPCTQYAFDPNYGLVPYQTTCTTRTNYYYNDYTFWVERDAKSFKVRGSSGSAKVRPGGRDGAWRKLAISYSPLYYGKTRKLTVTYDLPAGGPRTATERRVGHAYSTFCASGPGTSTGTLKVVVPAGFDMRLTRSMTATTAGGKTTFSSGQIKEPWKFSSCLTGTNDAGYTITPVTLVDGRTISVQSWKEDAAWAAAVHDAVAQDLPALTKLLGPAGNAEGFVVREEIARASANAYYSSSDATLHLTESVATRATATRALGGLWFGSALFTEPWMRDGYAAWAEHEAGVVDASCPRPAAVPAAGAGDLSRWMEVRPGSSKAQLEVSAYQGQAACYVVSTIADAIGTERMLATIDAMRTGTDPFTGVASPVDGAAAVGWQTWLDIVGEQGLVPAGADADLAASLAGEYGITAAADDLAAHKHAIAAYHELVAVLGKPAPAAVTGALRTWDFEPAEAAIATARDAWETASSIEMTLPGVETSGGAVETAVLGAKTQADLDAAAALADRQVELATDVADAIALEHAPRDAIQELGLVGATLPDDAVAVEAVSRIDTDAAQSTVAGIRALIDGARDAGTQRLALGIGGIVVLVLLGFGVVALRRRRRRMAASLAAPALVEPDVPAVEGVQPADVRR